MFFGILEKFCDGELRSTNKFSRIDSYELKREESDIGHDTIAPTDHLREIEVIPFFIFGKHIKFGIRIWDRHDSHILSMGFFQSVYPIRKGDRLCGASRFGYHGDNDFFTIYQPL
jgi:hypothetical protein